MALEVKNNILENGIVVDRAYSRIDTISGSKDSLTLTLNYYVSQDAFNTGKPYFKTEQYTFVPSVEDQAPNFIKQGYEYLKTLPEYYGSVDVLE